jgi:hypothetical protein
MLFVLAMLLLPAATRTPDGSAPEVVRSVRYQLCDASGYPLARIERIDVSVQSFSPAGAAGIIGISGFSTDPSGRFSITYGAGAASGRELHSFRLDGKVIAAFVVERAPGSVEVSRKNMQDPE